jgi:hypothetical protein
LLRRRHSYVPLKKPMNAYTSVIAPNRALQTDLNHPGFLGGSIL